MATVRDTFSSREAIDKFLADLKVKEVKEGEGPDNKVPWDDDTHDTDMIETAKWLDRVVGDNVTDEHLTKEEQGTIDKIVDNFMMERLDIRSIRAHDTGLMEVLQEKLLAMTKNQMIEAKTNMVPRIESRE